jgi:hypothetical protein
MMSWSGNMSGSRTSEVGYCIVGVVIVSLWIYTILIDRIPCTFMLRIEGKSTVWYAIPPRQTFLARFIRRSPGSCYTAKGGAYIRSRH